MFRQRCFIKINLVDMFLVYAGGDNDNADKSIAGKWNLTALYDIPLYKYYNGKQMTPKYSFASSRVPNTLAAVRWSNCRPRS